MTDLERVELCIRRTASHFGANGNHEGDLLYDAFNWLAGELASSRIGAEDEEASDA